MVTTRRGGRTHAEEDEDSETNIPVSSVHHRQAAARAFPSPRPSRDTPGVTSTTAHRKRKRSVSSTMGSKKRTKRVSKAKDTIEVEGQSEAEGAIDGALNVLNSPRRNIVVELFRKDSTASAAANSRAGRRRVVTKPLRRQINSVELIEAANTQVEDEASNREPIQRVMNTTPRRRPTPANAEALGSPELQSSPVRRRPARLPADSEPSMPQAVRRSTRIRGPRQSSRPASRVGAPLPRVYEEEEEEEDKGGEEEEEEEVPQNIGPPISDAAPAPAPEAAALVIGDDEDDFLEFDTEATDEPESSASEDEESGAIPTAHRAAAEKARVAIDGRKYATSKRKMLVDSTHLNNMLPLMGSDGWTAAGDRWHVGLLDRGAFEVPKTKLARRCFIALRALHDRLDKVPSAVTDLDQHLQFLIKQEETLNGAMTSVNRVVTRIHSDSIRISRLHGLEDRAEKRFGYALAEDLSCVIPMLLLVLRNCFVCGVPDNNLDNGLLLPQSGEFSGAALEYMSWATAWLEQLEQSLTEGQGQQPDKAIEKNRGLLGPRLRKWKQHLLLAMDDYNEQVDKEARLRAAKQRDARTYQQRQEAEEEELAKREKQNMESFAQWKQILSEPRPLALKWARANAFSSRASSEMTGTIKSSPRVNTHHPHYHPPSSSRYSVPSTNMMSGALPPPGLSQQPPRQSSQHPYQQRVSSTLVLDYPPWPADEIEWFLNELKRPDRSEGYLHMCAEILERPLEEVRKEKERLRRLGLY